MTIYDNLVESAKAGTKFKIDFKKRSLRIGNKTVINNGEYKGELGQTMTGVTPFFHAEKLFVNYKNSRPGSIKSKSYFYARPAEEMMWEDLVIGEERLVAQARLEFFILTMILEGFEWKEEFGSWFYQSKTDKDFVLLKEWFVGENK